ncbi:MAG: glycosyltransferase [Pseudoalteromonas sp.]|uniref:glycosyltransferase n=1 Tax=Pseudoalteromonas sp. TaxID=53249 RepID=UPI00384B3C46
MLNELVSIYIPTHNRVELLQKSIDSILSQTYTNWEVIVVNDASTDGTSDYLETISSSDSRIRYFNNETPMGACYSRNLAINHATGKFVTGLDDDDMFTKDRLQIFIDSYDDSYAFLSADWRVFPSSLIKNVKRKLIYKCGKIDLVTLLDKNHIGNQVFIEKEKLIAVGGFDESLPAWQDYDLWVRLVKKYGAALKLKNKTQLILVDNSIARITNSIRRVDGIIKFKDKHIGILNDSQINRIEKIIEKISS